MTRNDPLFERLRDEARLIGASPNVDLHMHTTWTDGLDAVARMHETACARGISTILFSEHSRRSSGEWFSAFADEVRALSTSPCRALVGTEVKVLDFGGALDLAPEIARKCDLIMASVHRFPGERDDVSKGKEKYTSEQVVDIEFRLSMAALDNPDTDILGHPFGMSLRRFGVDPPWVMVEQLIEKAARAGKAFEINARYHPQPARLLAACMAAGAFISFGSNAHNTEDVGALIDHPEWAVRP